MRVEAERLAQRPEMLFDEIGREAIVARRHRRVRGEHDLRGDAADRFVRVDAFGDHPLPHQLQRGERAVAFVEMNHAR